MRRWAVALAIVALCGVPLRADVTVISVTTIEGAAASMMGGFAPRMVIRIKGTMARTDVDLGNQTLSSIMDVAGKRIIMLNAAQKTAQVLAIGAPAAAGGPPLAVPKVDATLKPTGQSRTISDARCEEHVFTMSIGMGDMSRQMPPEAKEMLKDLKMLMSGSMWVATSGPGADEYVTFQRALIKADMSLVMGGIPGMAGSGMDRLMNTFSGATGLPYLTEMTMTIQGGGPMAELMKQQGPMKVTSRVTEVSTASIGDDMFKVPEDYKVIK